MILIWVYISVQFKVVYSHDIYYNEGILFKNS